MTNILSTREIATGIWLIIFFVVIISISPPIFKAIIDGIKAACSKQLIIPFVAILLYTSILILALMQLTMWKNVFVKDIIVWVLFAGVPLCYGTINIKTDSHYFRNFLIANLKLIVVIEFINSSFTFSLVTEMIILPLISLFAMAGIVAEQKGEYQQASYNGVCNFGI